MRIQESLIMGKRLKALRRGRGLSHADLAAELKKNYHLEISVDSLKAYEVSNSDHPRAYRNERMRVEYLRCLADYYRVSVDYLLGNTDIPARGDEVDIAASLTGLPRNIIEILSEERKALCGDNLNFSGMHYLDMAGYILLALRHPEVREISKKLGELLLVGLPDGLVISQEDAISMACRSLGVAIGSTLERSINGKES